jgi:hypothetical protein
MGQWCDNMMCVPELPNGQPCTEDYQCQSGDCKQDYCCDQECESSCEACNLPGSLGSCINVPSGQDPNDDCVDPQTCNGNGMCQ